MGMTLDFKNLKMSWDDCHVPMREFPSVRKPRKNDGRFGPEPTVAEQLYYDALEEDLEDDNTLPTCDTTECSEDDYYFNDNDKGNDHAVDCGGVDDPEEEIDIGEAYVENPTKEIETSRYEDTDLNKVCRSATHLSQNQQNELFDVLSKYTKLFDNKLGKYTDGQIHLDLKPDAVPTQT
jgi:hypothetical protein